MTAQLLPHVRLGAGQPIVVLPGLSARLGSPARLGSWLIRRQIAGLAASRTAWSIDRRQGLPAGATIQDLAADYALTLRSLFSEPVDVVGISTGGSIALQLAADYPELVRRLVLVSSAHRLSENGRRIQRRTAHLLRSRRPRMAAAIFLANAGTNPMVRLIYAAVGFLVPRLVVGNHDPDLLITLEAEDEFDLEHRLEMISTPTLVAGGGRDRFYSAELFTLAATKMPYADLLLYRQAGHMSTQGNAPLISEIVRFLETPLPLHPQSPRRGSVRCPAGQLSGDSTRSDNRPSTARAERMTRRRRRT